MADLVFIVITVVFFASATTFITLCDRVIGPDGDHGDPQGTGEPEPERAPEREATVAGGVR